MASLGKRPNGDCDLVVTKTTMETYKQDWKLEGIKKRIELFSESLDLDYPKFPNVPKSWSTTYTFSMGESLGVNSQWRLNLLIEGKGIFVRLFQIDAGETKRQLYVNCVVGLLSSDDRLCDLMKTKNMACLCPITDYIQSELTTLACLLTFSEDCFEGDSLTFRVEMSIELKGEDWPAAGVQSDFGSKYKKRCIGNSKTLLNDGENADLSLVLTLDNTRIKAHRCILSVGSPVFATMLRQNMLEKNKGVVSIKDIGKEAMQIVLQFIYCGGETPQKNGENWKHWSQFAVQVVNAAEKYELPELKDWCEQNLASICTKENIAEFYQCAQTYGLEKASIDIVSLLNKNKLWILFA